MSPKFLGEAKTTGQLKSKDLKPNRELKVCAPECQQCDLQKVPQSRSAASFCVKCDCGEVNRVR